VVSVADAAPRKLGGTALDKGERALIATGHLTDFRCSYGSRSIDGDTIAIDAAGADTLRVGEGDTVWSVPK